MVMIRAIDSQKQAGRQSMGLPRLETVTEAMKMGPMTFFVAATLVGFQFGWEPRPEGGCQYIIELNADALDALRLGKPIESDLRPELLGEVRSIRIVMGDAMLPQRLAPRAPAALPPNPASKPLAEQPTAYVTPPGGNPAAGTGMGTGAGKGDSPIFVGRKLGQSPGYAAATTPDAKPWLPLWLAMVALFASLGGNIFLAWITWDARSRYRSLLGPAVA